MVVGNLLGSRRSRVVALALALVTGVAAVGASPHAVGAAPAGCHSLTGDGSQADPWTIWSDLDLTCFDAGNVWVPAGGPGSDAWVSLAADVSRESVLPVFASSGSSYQALHFHGNDHTITFRNVTNTPGLFADQVGIHVSNLTIAADNSTLASDGGWFMARDHDGTYTDVASTGDISLDGGGIVGSYSERTTIDRARSSGLIANFAGGIVGSRAGYVTVTRAYSTGDITGYGGGIMGPEARYSTVTSSFSMGAIQVEAGGIVGRFALFTTIANSYSAGVIAGSNAGGIAGTAPASTTIVDSYSLGALTGTDSGGIIGEPRADVVISNSYSSGALVSGYRVFGGADRSPVGNLMPLITNTYGVATDGWFDIVAASYLTGVPSGVPGVGSNWGSCEQNTPFFIAAFYPNDLCSTVLPASVEYSGSGMSSTAITGPTDSLFTLADSGGEGPFAWIALVNDSGSVRLGNVDCVDASACRVQDLPFGTGASSRTFTITDSGTVRVMRFALGASGPVEIATLTVSRAVQNPLTITSTEVVEGQPLALTAIGGSGSGAVTWSLVSGSCSVVGTSLQPMAAGTPCVVRVEKAGDATYEAASSAATAITVIATPAPIDPAGGGTLPATGRDLPLPVGLLLFGLGAVFIVVAEVGRRAHVRSIG